MNELLLPAAPEESRMSEEPKPVEILEAQITAIFDTHKNIAGSIEKTTRIQADLSAAGFGEFADRLNEPFSDLSSAAEKVQSLLHDIEIERNRARNEE
jgi:hypothetical protein